ncbi:MAG: hypothetical protein PVG75_05570 [Thioalkalispiraceae bacterium]|jgi:hypothetical protein
MTKLKAFATHLGISLVIFFAILAFIIYFWYPAPFFASDGGWQGIRIIAAVDLVLGPVLTLIVFKPGKPHLKLDLTIIGLVQASALAWGIWVVHYERPIAAVYAEGAFTTVTANDMKSRGLDKKELKKFGERTPVWIYSDLPESTDEMQQIRIRAAQSGRSVHLFTEYYVPIDKGIRNKLIAKSFNLGEWVENKPEATKNFDQFIKAHQSEIENIVFFPWHARYARQVIAMRKKDMSYVETLNIKPPEAGEEKTTYVK